MKWWVVFFAPSSAEFALPILREYFAFAPANREGDQDSQFCRAAAIGPTTMTHVEEKWGVKVYAVAEKPSPEALGQSLLGSG